MTSGRLRADRMIPRPEVRLARPGTRRDTAAMHDLRPNDSLAARLDRLERSNRRWRLAALSTLMCTALLGLLAAARPASPLVQTQRLEILGADGNLIAALGSDERGGRLDLWSADGKNVFRTSVNEHGGDLNIWNREERTIAAAFATSDGGALRLWNQRGERGMSAAADPEGGHLTLNSASGATIRARSAGGEEMFSVHSGAGAVASVGIHQSGGGTLRMAEPEGQTLLRMETRPGGRSSLSMYDPSGRRRTLLSTSSDGSSVTLERSDGSAAGVLGATTAGGFLDLSAAQGHRVFKASANAAGSGVLTMAGPTGSDFFTLESTDQGSATMALFTGRGRRALIAGARPEGGILNLFNQHDVAVIAASFAPGGLGGALSVRNGRGLAVIDLESKPDESGLVTVMDAEGERPRRLAPLP